VRPSWNARRVVGLGRGGVLTGAAAGSGGTAGWFGAGGAGLFTVTGAALVDTITLPLDGTCTVISGRNSMAVDGFIRNPLVGSLVGGPETFNVGATLTVGADQPIGTYLGTYPVSVNYN